MDTFDADVVIVGGGPTGMMLAGELRLHDIRTLVLEKLAEPVRQSRALGFSARAMEEFDQRGLLDRFGEVQVIPVGHFGGLPLDFRVLPGGSYGARGIPQARTTGILAEWATGLGAEVRRGHEVVGLAEHAGGVELAVSTPDGPATVRARWVVGCDGGHSPVRKLAGIDFPGTEPVIEMWMADVSGVELTPRFAGERVDNGMVMVLPAGPGVSRIGVYERDSAPRHATTPPSFDQVAAAFQRLTGQDISAATPLWVSWFTDASRQAATYRKGRVLLAGDAAHVHLPQGGQGMSGGIGDAQNLGWKLAAEVAGHAPAGLLDSYDAERRPVGARVLVNTLAQRILYLGDEEVDPLRDLFAELLEHESVRRHLAGMVSGLDIRYPVQDGDHPLTGRRLPDHELVRPDKTTVFRLLHAGRPVLLQLADGSGAAAAAEPWRDRVDVVTAALHDGAGSPLDGLDAVLIRPDGYVAWAAPAGAGAPGPAAALARWSGPAR